MVLVFAVVAAGNTSVAQSTPASTTSAQAYAINREVRYADPLRPPGLRMRNTGRTLTIAGSILLISGIAMMATADEIFYTTTYSSSGSYSEGDPQGAVGLILTAAGAGMAIPGIIFWDKGSKRYKAYLSNARASVRIARTGLALCLHF